LYSFLQRCLVFVFVLPIAAQIRQPDAAPLPPAITAPRDQPYPGTIQLSVDATDLQRRIINVHETVPVHTGNLTLLYPEWIPGDHSPTGPIPRVAGLVINANGNPVQWMRDRVNVYAFHIPVPPGVTSLDVQFQYLSPVRNRDGRISMSDKIIDLEWSDVVLYPAGYFSRRIEFAPKLKLPPNWQFATALDAASRSGDEVEFKSTTLNTLVDSPLYAGSNYKRIDLSTAPDNQVFLNVFGDTPESITLTPEQLQLHKNLTQQAQKLYASHHYGRYEFLFLLSDTVGGIGLEHHQSSEDGEKKDYFTKWNEFVPARDLLAHEYTHSWNGKFRRPADLWTPNFSVPMQGDLLWVYEGMTQYWGYVLTARAGLRTPEETRDLIARVAANFDASPGRNWRPLVDTTNQPTMSQRRPVSWVSWQRPEDYYTEGMLIWLDTDTKIRELSGGEKSLDDFARLFFGVHNGSFVTDTYTFDDVVTALNTVQPFDWAAFLKARVYQVATHTPQDGITRGGYKLTYSDTPPAWQKDEDHEDHVELFGTGIGISVSKDGIIENVWWDSPAFKTGLTPGMQITAINGTAFKDDVLKAALIAAEKDTAPVKFLVKRGEQFQTIDVDYHGGLRYPKLTRQEGTPDRLTDILAPK
jgi:predicted metalloprotease with PDZ domain